MPNPNTEFWDQPIDFWEQGPVRKVIDLAFDAVVVRTREQYPIDDFLERQLREQILPSVFLSIGDRINELIDNIGDRLGEYRDGIESEIEQHLLRELNVRTQEAES